MACLLVFISAKDLAAAYYHGRISGILDDKTTEYLDVKGISESTLPDYTEAISSLQKAVALDPSNSIHHKALSDLYSKLGRWAETMGSLNQPLPSGALSKDDAFKNALNHLRRAVSLEPANPDYRLALGQLYSTVSADPLRANREFAKAIEAFPVNVPLRFSAAMYYLLSGNKEDALAQAQTLARLDDSYIVPQSFRKDHMVGRRSKEYMSVLYESYLFKALEIAWRASQDPRIIEEMAPANADAKAVSEAFMEWKGLDL